jgi:hypothetical protein
MLSNRNLELGRVKNKNILKRCCTPQKRVLKLKQLKIQNCKENWTGYIDCGINLRTFSLTFPLVDDNNNNYNGDEIK